MTRARRGSRFSWQAALTGEGVPELRTALADGLRALRRPSLRRPA